MPFPLGLPSASLRSAKAGQSFQLPLMLGGWQLTAKRVKMPRNHTVSECMFLVWVTIHITPEILYVAVM